MLNYYTSIPADAVVSYARPMFGTSWKMQTISHHTYTAEGKISYTYYNYHQKNDIWQAPVNGVASPVPKPYDEANCGALFVYRQPSNLNLWKIYRLSP